MANHSELLTRYRQMREVSFRVGNLLVKTIPRDLLDECAKILGFSRKGTLVFESEDEMAVLMDYCLYYHRADDRNLVAEYLEKSPPPPGSDEIAVLQAMTRAYYSIFQVTEIERGVGVVVRDILRDETGFIADVGFGSSAQRGMGMATRVIPGDGFLMTGGAALPVEASAGRQISDALTRSAFNPEVFDFRRITPRQEAELAALIIRTCRAAGMSSQVTYQDPEAHPRRRPIGPGGRRVGRNDPCPCGSGKKYKMCCGIHQR